MPLSEASLRLFITSSRMLPDKQNASCRRRSAQLEKARLTSPKGCSPKADCYRMFRRWWWFCEQSNSFARLQSIAYCCAFIPALKKLYGNDPEEYKAALQRHLMFFNTEGHLGLCHPRHYACDGRTTRDGRLPLKSMRSRASRPASWVRLPASATRSTGRR